MGKVTKDFDINHKIEMFLSGDSTDAYELLGCHLRGSKCTFRVWAPHARSVSVHGDFNNWDVNSPKMTRLNGGIWEITVDGVRVYDNYKYYIETSSGQFVYKTDPYGFHTCTRPENASKVYNITSYKWSDSEYLKEKSKKQKRKSPNGRCELHKHITPAMLFISKEKARCIIH